MTKSNGKKHKDASLNHKKITYFSLFSFILHRTNSKIHMIHIDTIKIMIHIDTIKIIIKKKKEMEKKNRDH